MVSMINDCPAASASARGQPIEFRLVFGAALAAGLPLAAAAWIVRGGRGARPMQMARAAAWSAALATVPQAPFGG